MDIKFDKNYILYVDLEKHGSLNKTQHACLKLSKKYDILNEVPH